MQPLRLLCINYAHFYWKLHVIPYPKLIPPPATPPSPTLAILIAHIHLHSRPRHCHTQSQTWLQQLHTPHSTVLLLLPPSLLHPLFSHTHTPIFIALLPPAVCNQFSRGVYSMLGAVSPDSFDTLHSYSNTFQMPFVTPWFPEKVSTVHSAQWVRTVTTKKCHT